MDESERKTLENIEKYGCSVMHIMEEGDLPPFTYSVGIERTSQTPEAIVIGLKSDLAHFVLNEYNRRIRAGETFLPGHRYAGFIGGFDIAIERVDKLHYEEYFGANIWLYQGTDFAVNQIVYPNTSGLWPWSSGASEGFRARQPVLTSTPASNK